jgi:hypothetical protein
MERQGEVVVLQKEGIHHRRKISKLTVHHPTGEVERMDFFGTLIVDEEKDHASLLFNNQKGTLWQALFVVVAAIAVGAALHKLFLLH